jgi:putative nucleotidyltransferase with HDIG domain
MSLYRVKQFIWALKAMRENIDVEYVNKYLNTNEKELFNKLKKTDKQHCIRVSKDVVKYSKLANISTHRVAKVALLHDIGKGYYGLNIIEKSVLVILNKVTKGKLKKYNNIKAIDSYYNHAKKGADLLKKFNKYDKEFLDSIRYHHSNKKISNKLLDIIRESDNKN